MQELTNGSSPAGGEFGNALRWRNGGREDAKVVSSLIDGSRLDTTLRHQKASVSGNGQPSPQTNTGLSF